MKERVYRHDPGKWVVGWWQVVVSMYFCGDPAVGSKVVCIKGICNVMLKVNFSLVNVDDNDDVSLRKKNGDTQIQTHDHAAVTKPTLYKEENLYLH